MPSNYTGDPTNGVVLTVEMLDDGDAPAAQLWRTPEELLLDNDASLAQLQVKAVALKQRRVTKEGASITDTTEFMAAVQRDPGTPIIACKVAQAFGLGDSDRFEEQGVPASITVHVRDAATDGTRILVVGEGGNRSTFSDDDGATWSAGGDIGGTGFRVIWNEVLGLFLCGRTASVSRSTDGVAWAASTGDIVAGGAGLAVMANGDVYAIGSPATDIEKSTDGIDFANTAGTPPSAGTLDDSGSIVGNAGDVFFHAGRHSSGANIIVSSSPDGVTFTTLATLTPQGSASFASIPRLLMCKDTGLLVLVAPTTGNQCALYASNDLGATWTTTPAVIFPDPGIGAFAIAGGRLLSTQDDMLFASDGVRL